MSKLDDLHTELEALEATAAQIREQGDVIQDPDFWLDTTHNSKTSKTYYRRCQMNEQGKKQRVYISQAEHTALRQQIDRGRELKRISGEIDRLKKQIGRVQKQSDRVLEKARELGLM
jgi:hypothetical protein